MTKRWIIAAALASLSLSGTVYALGTDRAVGTPLNPPKEKLDNAACLACHQPVKKLHERGAHKDLNCGSCHTAKPEHMKTPSAENRPATRFDYGSCSQCHTAQHKDLMDPKYHYEWAEKFGNPGYTFLRDEEDGWARSVQFKFPRFHPGIMSDFLANRANGRFKYDSKRDQGVPQEDHWKAITDKFEENGELMKGDVIGIGWRPHKGREGSQDSRCLLCKTSETMLEYQYDLMVPNPKGYDFSSPVVPMLKETNTSFNCNMCHDPHSAEPRIIFSPLIESMAGKNGADNYYQKNAGKDGLPKIEVVDMGVRGFTRKIGILSDYNANFQCGQCHNGANRYLNYKHVENGKPVTKEELEKAGVSPYSTEFLGNPIKTYEWFKKMGWYQGIHGVTGAKYINGSDHPHVEMLINSKHGKAGVDCADCHFAKKADGTMEHQPSLPKQKVENTCMRSDCHGPGTKDNWTRTGQALYTIEAIQQEHRIRTMKMEMAAKEAQRMLKAVKEKKAVIADKEYKALMEAFEQYLSVRDYFWTDYSIGFHSPEAADTSLTKCIWDLRAANKAAKKVFKEVQNTK